MYKSPLHETTKKYNTDFWNDSCSIPEIEYALEYGAVGATTNPVIVKNVIEGEYDKYEPILQDLVNRYPEETEDMIAWRIIEQTAVDGAKLLEEIYHETKGQKGRISIQTNTKYNNSPELMSEQAIYFNTLAPNIQVKMPVTEAGVKALEEATYNGVSVNATVSFSVAQAVAVAEAVERGLDRRIKEGLDVSEMHPVCTIMVGRVDDHLKAEVERLGVEVDPAALEWGGVAVMKEAYSIFKERGYRTGLLAAAYRNDNQWTEFVGGDLELTIPHKWIVKFNESGYTPEARMDLPVDAKIMEELRKIPTFNEVYDEDGLKGTDFDNLGATQKTLRQFYEGYDSLIRIIREIQLNSR